MPRAALWPRGRRTPGPLPLPDCAAVPGGTVRMVVEAAGIKDILSKSKGSSNPHNVVKATFKALLDIRRPEEIARMRGISLTKVFNG